MRKDFIAHGDLHNESEIAFVERFWTENWKRSGEVEGHVRRFSGRLDRWRFKSEWRMMRRFLDRLPSRRLLDAGCGTGEWTRHLRAQGFSTLGLDISRETVEKLCALFPDEEFAVGDIRDTGLEAGQFGGLFSWGTFEHFETGLQPCIEEAYRLLQPGGYLFITVPFDSFSLALKSLFERPDPGVVQGLRFYQWRFSKRELALELSLGGFEIERVLPIHRRQGIVRFLHHSFGVHYDNRVVKGLGLLIGAVMPRSLCAHMLIAVARKPVGE